MMRRRFHSDAGLSLAEMLVVIALLGVVLGAAYSVLFLVNKSSAENESAAWGSREVGQPLEYLERLLSQRLSNDFAGDGYRVQIKTDRDLDDHYETYVIEAMEDGRLLITMSEEVDQLTATTSTWSTHNANRHTTTPLFTYYDIHGEDISASSSENRSRYTSSMKVTIVAEKDGRQVSDSRRVFLRNK